jgi:hypothetical protein
MKQSSIRCPRVSAPSRASLVSSWLWGPSSAPRPSDAEQSLSWRREGWEEEVATVYLKLALGSLRGLMQFICFLSTELVL